MDIQLVLDTVCTPEQGTNARIVDLLAKKEKQNPAWEVYFDAFGVKFSFFHIRTTLGFGEFKGKSDR